ncbi:MAG: outer membrane lipoprotein LolB [Pseudomonadota bacterium]
MPQRLPPRRLTESTRPTLQRRAAGAALCAAVLAGCATVMPDTALAPYRERIALSGRLSVNYHQHGDGAPASLTGKFNWSQQPGRIDVGLASPTGQTIATLSVTPQAAVLEQAGQAPRAAHDVDSLSAQALGWALPVSGLRDWLQGRAIDADGKPFAASPRRDSVITRDGWRLRFVSWQDEAAVPARPKRIDAERVTAVAAEEMSIRIVIDPQE